MFSKIVALVSKLMARLSEFRNWHNDVWERQDGVKDDHVDITTGVTTRFPGGVDGYQAGYEGIWQATQVGPRPVEAGLGGHNDDVSGGRRGGRESAAPVMKTGTIGDVGLSHLQCVLWTSERFSK